MANTMKTIESIKIDNRGQTSVEVILLIGSILVISIICGTYIYKINLEINELFNQTIAKGRLFLLNKLNWKKLIEYKKIINFLVKILKTNLISNNKKIAKKSKKSKKKKK